MGMKDRWRAAGEPALSGSLRAALADDALAWSVRPAPPWGELLVVAGPGGLHRIHLAPTVDEVRSRAVPGTVGRRDDALLAPIGSQLLAFLERPADVELDLPIDVPATPFQRRAWSAMRRIPAGSVMTYGELASELDRPGGARAVGAACGSNPVPFVVPCHRVVARGGDLGGFGLGLPLKTWLLRAERGEGALPFAESASAGS